MIAARFELRIWALDLHLNLKGHQFGSDSIANNRRLRTSHQKLFMTGVSITFMIIDDLRSLCQRSIILLILRNSRSGKQNHRKSTYDELLPAILRTDCDSLNLFFSQWAYLET